MSSRAHTPAREDTDRIVVVVRDSQGAFGGALVGNVNVFPKQVLRQDLNNAVFFSVELEGLIEGNDTFRYESSAVP